MTRQFVKLKPSHSRKNYSHAKTFGLSAAPLPDELLFLSPVLTQNGNKCTAYGSVAIRESMTNHAYDAELQWEQELQFVGATDAPNGMEFKVPFAVGCKVGFMPDSQPLPTDKASAYFFVNRASGLDLFDSIRQTINQIQAPLGVGLDWMQDWDTSDGIVPHSAKNLLGSHFTKIAGFTKKNGVDYLCIQNSWGEAYGDQGKFYFDRFMVNKYFGTYGIAYWSDSQDVKIKTLGLIQAFYQQIVSLLTRALL